MPAAATNSSAAHSKGSAARAMARVVRSRKASAAMFLKRFTQDCTLLRAVKSLQQSALTSRGVRQNPDATRENVLTTLSRIIPSETSVVRQD